MSTAPEGWSAPKTAWVTSDPIHAADLSRIETNANATELGNRTLDQGLAAPANIGTLRQILSWFAGRLRAITGAANWWDTPATTLAAANTHHGDTAAHGAVAAPTVSRLIIRDAAGRAQVAAPSVGADIARLDSITAVQAGAVRLTGDTMTGNLTAPRFFHGLYGRNTVRLPSGTDLNTIAVTDIYDCINFLNRPAEIPNWAYLQHIQYSEFATWATQIIYGFHDDAHTFFRRSREGIWGPWQRFWRVASSLPTASVLMERDAAGRAQVAAPSVAADIARLDTVTNHSGTTTAPIHGSTVAATANTLVHRDAAGNILGVGATLTGGLNVGTATGATTGEIRATANVRIGGGLFVGGTGVGPVTGCFELPEIATPVAPGADIARTYARDTNARTNLFMRGSDNIERAITVGQGALVRRTTTQSIPHSTWTDVIFNETASWNNDTCHSTATNPSRLTCNTPGIYVISGTVPWVHNTTGARGISIVLNGTDHRAQTYHGASPTIATTQNVNTILEMEAGNFVELLVHQTSGGALDIAALTPWTSFSMVRVG